ncbi:chorismate transformation enzyme, FkbO/Hyg5 family [Pseudogulbenkiania subflava]|uniref:Enamine deaminase RidA, house cleaning of reactive enamine intermediates, YjgF/YER057c/UK114 family n=1 Tax=Pseudogulbenkiania subflava DSM 22618 TaxID=1123014 RepID=A0A1Y6BSD4_9NEIS|nr:hypothetical protein [Pseudogulbenkiania subflava]SMF25695.1 Enamine deaminase RidA, house cleaning of reactive enamine intermediates, YjgF/YER057c/UK114 family [Pseudogulbenkiania subflava DSM 22618]
MSPDTSLQFFQCDPSANGGHPLPANAGILGMSSLHHPAPALPWPVQRVHMPLLGGWQQLHEYWHSATPCRRGRFQDIHFSSNGDLLYGVIELEEGHGSDIGTALQLAAEKAYRQLFSLLEAEGFPHLWRVWNYVPRINEVEHGLERYRQFNIGRHQAFADFARPVDSSPAACALGVAEGPLSIAFLAARRAARGIENPRQISAFEYPRQYGPRSPTFTRAAIADSGRHDILFISGTASIVGHGTVHIDDVVAQTRETVANIAVLVEQARQLAPAAGYALAGLDYRVYIRHAADYPKVRATLEQLIGRDIRAVYVQADVCRSDLLVEVEAHGIAIRPELGTP